MSGPDDTFDTHAWTTDAALDPHQDTKRDSPRRTPGGYPEHIGPDGTVYTVQDIINCPRCKGVSIYPDRTICALCEREIRAEQYEREWDARTR